MRKLLVAVVATTIALSTASSATAQTTTVPLAQCLGVGSYTIPAGSEVILDLSWSDTERSLVKRFLSLQQTDFVFNGVRVADASSFWGRPKKVKKVHDLWAATWSYNLGSITGSHTLSYDIVLTEQLITGDGTVYGPGSVFGGPLVCTLHGV
jgi:hypothetical protein